MIFSFLFIFLFLFCDGEYHITEDVIPSYLTKTFYNLSEHIFPYDIMISLSMSRVTGTLLYSIDTNGNQLIVSLNDMGTLHVEFSEQHFYFSLPRLCECERYRFEKMTLRIQMRESMHLQCNERIMETRTYERSKKLNKNYPIIHFNKTNKLEAHLWLVNTPQYENLYPNSAQLYGCIFDVWYNNELIKMESVGVGNKCNITCTPGVCHSGECLETYNTNPICNCTSSFNNGKFCNDTIDSQNYEVIKKVQFKTVKLSFTSTSEDLFQLNNKREFLKLVVMRGNLLFIINCTIQFPIIIESVISQRYRYEDQNVVILTFEPSYIDVKFHILNSSWTLIRIPHSNDLSKEPFEKISLHSKNGSIDVAFKNSVQSAKWHKLVYMKEEKILINHVVSHTTGKFKLKDNCTVSSNEHHSKDQLILLENKVLSYFGSILFLMIFIIALTILSLVINLRIWKLRRSYSEKLLLNL